MISLQQQFPIYEISFEQTKQELSKFFDNLSVNNFIKLSKKMVTGGLESLTEKEQVTYRGFFDDPEVVNYINAARRAGERDGWLYGGIGGGILGLIITLIGSVASSHIKGAAATIAIALAGAGGAGFITGLTFSKVNSWLRKWKAEDDIVKLGTVGGKLGKTLPILNV